MKLQEQTVKPQGKGMFFSMTLVVCFLAFTISKNVALSPFFLIIATLIGGAYLLMRGISRPEIITYALVAYLPFSKELAGDFGGLAMAFNFTNLLMTFVMIVWLTGKFAQDEPLWLATPLNFPILLFMGIGFISLVRGSYFASGEWFFSIIEYKRWITPIFMFFLVLNTVKDRQTIKNLTVIMMIVTTVVGLMAIYDYMNVGETASLDRSRIGGIADQPNMLAAFFNYYMFLPFGFFLMNMKKFKYWLLNIPFLLQFRGVMVTFSRGGYMAFALGLYAIAFFRSKFLFLLLLVATCIVYLNPVLLPAGIRYRMGQTFENRTSYVDTGEVHEADLDRSAADRVEVWKGALQMIKEQPLFGVGYGLFEPMIQYYWSGERKIDAHNTYLIIAAEMGIPALLVFLLIVLMTLGHTYGLYKRTEDPFSKALALGFIGGIFGLLMSNMFGSRLDSQEVSSYFWILAALVMRLKILDKKEKDGGWKIEDGKEAGHTELRRS